VNLAERASPDFKRRVLHQLLLKQKSGLQNEVVYGSVLQLEELNLRNRYLTVCGLGALLKGLRNCVDLQRLAHA